MRRGSGGHFTEFVQSGPGLEVVPQFDSTIDVSQLQRVAWVVVVTPNVVAEHAQDLAHLSCYCARVGIPLHIEHLVMVTNLTPHTARHRSVAKYLRYYQWIVATDADTVILDSTRDPREFLDDSVDVIFNDRDNHEIASGAYMIRNSPGGWSFLRRWLAWADEGSRANRDNGDLLELVAAGMRPGIPNNADGTGRALRADIESNSHPEGTCINGAHEEYKAFIQCFNEQLSTHRYSDDTVRYWTTELWSWVRTLPPITFRSYKVNSGFFRNAEGLANWFNLKPWYLVAIDGDFLAGGKHLHKHFTPDSVLCSGNEWRYPEK